MWDPVRHKEIVNLAACTSEVVQTCIQHIGDEVRHKETVHLSAHLKAKFYKFYLIHKEICLVMRSVSTVGMKTSFGGMSSHMQQVQD